MNFEVRYECDNCDKSFARSYGLARHKRESCVGRFENLETYGKRPRIAGPAPDIKCDLCDVYFPSNRLAAHQRTAQHRSKACVPVSYNVQLIQTAFKGRLATYRISSDSEHIDYVAFFEEIKPKVFDVISGVLQVQNTVKINMEAVGLYYHAVQDLYSEKFFNTCNHIVALGNDLNDVYGSFAEAMMVQSTEYQEKDSGWYIGIIIIKIYNF
jgi:hypothetical protein